MKLLLSCLIALAPGALFAAGVLEVRAPGYGFQNAEYTVSHVYIDEVAGTTADIEKKLSELRVQCQIKPVKIKATNEEIKKGVPASYEVPVTFDNSNFFG